MDDYFIRRLDKTEADVDVYGNGSVTSLYECDDSVTYVAIENNLIIGALCIIRKPRKDTKTVQSLCTGVLPFRHRRGVAKALWGAMIKKEKPSRIKVSVATRRGESLIRSLEKKHKKIKWMVT